MTNDELRMTNEGVNCLKYISFTFCVLSFALLLTSCAPKEKKKPLETAKVTRGTISAQLPTTGVVIPRNRLGIKPPVSGRIESVLVVEGQQVKKGQILAWMSSSERAVLMDAARAKGPEEEKHWEDIYRPAPILAPLSGFLIKKNMEPGQFFAQSEDVLVLADKLIVQGQVDETDIGRVRLNQKVGIKLDAYPDQEIPGVVEQIAYESETVNNVTVYKVNVIPEKVPSFFRAGMSATVNFKIEERKNVLTLPLSAVKKKGGRSYIFVRQDDKIKSQQVETGLENSENLEVVSGAAEGEEVIIPTQKIVQKALGNNGPRTPFNFLGSGNRKR